MRFMEENPREGFVFIFLNVEDVNSSEDYFRMLSEELLKSEAIGKLARLSNSAKNTLSSFLDRIKKIKVWNIELETVSGPKPTYAEEFERLLQELDTDDLVIGILVDEFPVALENIGKVLGNNAAITFLHANRSIRQRSNSGVRFIYTGSIGLPNISRKLGATATINDLNVVEVPPLSLDEGMDFSKKLFDYYAVPVSDETRRYMLNKIEWLMPFFVQLVVQMIIDEYDNLQRPIENKDVDRVLEKAANHRNNIYFENYYSRLDKTLPEDESRTAKEILAGIAIRREIPATEFTQANAITVLDILEFDGYIHQAGGFFRFNSPILRMWWAKFVAGK